MKKLVILLLLTMGFTKLHSQDLIVSELRDVPVQQNPGETFTFRTTIENVGTNSVGTTLVKYYLSSYTSLAGGLGDYIGSDGLAALSPGQDDDENHQYTIPSNYSPGQYYIIAVADADHDETETDESNNERFKPIIIGGYSPAKCDLRDEEPASWDWRQENYTFYIDYDGEVIERIVQSPWFSANSSNNNILEFRNQNPKDWDPSDGWELVYRDFGTLSFPTNHPFFILYNRFTGILRVFATVTDEYPDFNSANLRLGFVPSSNRNALLENNVVGVGHSALDQFDPYVKPIDILNQFNNDPPYFWMHADYIMNYDPCSCDRLYQIFFEIELVSESTLQFNLNGMANQQLTSIGSDSRINVSEGVQELVKFGNGSHKAVNTYFKNQKDAENWTGLLGWIGTPLLNTFGPVGAILSIGELLIGVSNDKPKDVNPLIFDIDLQADGNITTTSTYPYQILEVPGSDHLSLNPPSIIEYDQPLGVFNLTKTPKVKHVGYTVSNGQFRRDRYLLDEKLEYTLNPSANFDIENVTVQAAYIVEFPYAESHNFVDDSHLVDFHLINQDLDRAKSIFSSDFVPIGELSKVQLDLLTSEYQYVGVDPKIYIKVIATLPVKNNPNETVYMSLFRVELEETSVVYDWEFWLGVESQESEMSIDQNSFTYPLDPTTVCNSLNYIARSEGGGEGRVTRGDGLNNSKSFALNLIEKDVDDFSFRIFPNPANDFINIKYDGLSLSNTKVSILNVSGQVLSQDVFKFSTAGYKSVSTSKLPTGAYVILIESGNQIFTEKLMINR